MKKRCGFLVLSFFCLSITLSAECIKGNCYTGFGTYVYANGASYQGNFFQGKMDGNGVLKMSNGSKYLGSWKAGKSKAKAVKFIMKGMNTLGIGQTMRAMAMEEWRIKTVTFTMVTGEAIAQTEMVTIDLRMVSTTLAIL